MTIIALSRESDAHVDRMEFLLNAKDLQLKRLTVESLLREGFAIRPSDAGAASINWGLHSPGGDDVFWYRKPDLLALHSEAAPGWQNAYIEEELRALLMSVWSTTRNARWVNSPYASMLAGDRVRQCVAAAELGFDVPEWSVTNRAALLPAAPRLVIKRLSSRKLQLPTHLRIHTSHLDRDRDASGEDFERGVALVQARVAVRSEVKVVIARSIFAFELPRSTDEPDYRIGEDDGAWQAHDIDDLVATKCRALVSNLGLSFGVVDLAVDAEGRMWFLEVNPNGEYTWLDDLVGGDITRSVLELLC